RKGARLDNSKTKEIIKCFALDSTATKTAELLKLNLKIIDDWYIYFRKVIYYHCMNGLLREYIPKGTDFSTVTKEDIERYVKLINNRPRKRLGFMTSNEVIEEEMKSCIGL
ncbi:MAG: hypothetical protein PHF26_03585, partial [Candidatus Gracilibacteria bacterium]|nr:hypothetical protein [Candidatus Gracilibacteria bacterium]